MKIGVLGGGGREHALQWTLAKSPHATVVHCLPGNGGTIHGVPLDPCDLDAVAQACRDLDLDLLVVGPEAPLAAGIVDRMAASSTRVFGPTQAAARLESSKLFAKAFMRRHGIPTAEFTELRGPEDLASAFDRFGSAVLKADGLASGKGVVVCRNAAELEAAWHYVQSLRPSGERFLAEACLEGWELSVMILTDGETWRAFPASQDHKPLLDGDRGPNTGGMGAFCPVPACSHDLMHSIEESVIRPTLAGLRADGLPYRGFLYFGLMLTADGPQLLEYNVRLGDPEAEALLSALDSDLCEAIVASLDGGLADVDLRFSTDFFVDVVLASPGYPGTCEIGHAVSHLAMPVERPDRGGRVFHGATKLQDGLSMTAGGRVLHVVGSAPTLDEAIARTYDTVKQVAFDGAVYRGDIGQRLNRLVSEGR